MENELVMTSNEIKKAYRRERNRILRAVHNMSKKGFDLEGFSIPAIPKRITSGSVRRLQKITTKSLQEKAFGPLPTTGEKVDYRKYSNIKRTKSYKRELRQKEYRELIEQNRREQEERYRVQKELRDSMKPDFEKIGVQISPENELGYTRALEIISNYTDRAERITMTRIRELVSSYGYEAVGAMLREAIDNGILVDPSDSYNIGKIYRMLEAFYSLLGLTDTEKTEAYNSFDEESWEYF